VCLFLPYPSLACLNSVIPGGRLRSPPPPVQIIHSPPPVPRRPRPLNLSRVLPPDVVRPNAEPLAFERAMTPLITRPASHPPPGDAPPPRRPIINLGGGFTSSNHQLEAELFRRQQARDRARQRYFEHLRIARGIHQRHGFLSQTIGRIFPSWLFADPTEEEMMDALAFSELAAPDFGLFGFGEDQAPFRRTTHEYRVAHTHPYPPAPGFAHDFESPSPSVNVIDVDEEPSPSTKASGSSSPSKNNENFNTLVCARCLDPLVLGGSNMSEDERSRRRLWGLRCGHMLDGKCIDELMKPRPAPDLELTGTEVVAPSSGSQGQSTSTQSQDGTQSVVPGEAIPSNGMSASRFTKARGKARAIEPPSQSSQPAEVTSNQTVFTENNSIRSRLRSRNNTGHVGHIFSLCPTSSHTWAQVSQSSSQRTPVTTGNRSNVVNTHHHPKKRAKGKGKQKAMEPVILERYEWRCPVAHCERLHVSVNIESRGWVMDETQGAISIFA
jgi:hypothetical protein